MLLVGSTLWWDQYDIIFGAHISQLEMYDSETIVQDALNNLRAHARKVPAAKTLLLHQSLCQAVFVRAEVESVTLPSASQIVASSPPFL